MPIGVFLLFLQYCFIMSYTPGPANLFAMNVGMRYGMKRFLKVYCGLFSAFFIIMVSTAILCYGFEQFIPEISRVLKILGTIYILWLSYIIFKSKEVEENEGKEVKKDFRDCYLSGFLLNMTNVKIMIYCVSVLQMYLLTYYTTLQELFLWSIPISVFSSSSTIVWALLGSRLSKSYNRHYKIYNTIMSGILVLCVLNFFR